MLLPVYTSPLRALAVPGFSVPWCGVFFCCCCCCYFVFLSLLLIRFSTCYIWKVCVHSRSRGCRGQSTTWKTKCLIQQRCYRRQVHQSTCSFACNKLLLTFLTWLRLKYYRYRDQCKTRYRCITLSFVWNAGGSQEIGDSLALWGMWR